MTPDSQVDALRAFVERTTFDPTIITSRSGAIYDDMLRRSTRGAVHLDGANFTVAHDRDLRLMCGLYDAIFFEHRIMKALGDTPLALRFSTRMTSAAGTTTRRVYRNNGHRVTLHEIVISCHLLFQTFADIQRSVSVAGILCHDRLQALQRVLEHELIHLTEMIVWDESSCSGRRFHLLSHNLFGHTQWSHDLVTSRERALRRYRIRVGDHVSFEVEGVRHRGVVNRITKRATVLVESDKGVSYSNGRRYLKFYVPLSMLRPSENEREAS